MNAKSKYCEVSGLHCPVREKSTWCAVREEVPSILEWGSSRDQMGQTTHRLVSARFLIVFELNVGVMAQIHTGYTAVAAYIEARICKSADDDTPWRYTVCFVIILYHRNA